MTTDTEEPTNIKAACWAFDSTPSDPEFLKNLGREMTEFLQWASRSEVFPLEVLFRSEAGKTFIRLSGPALT